VVGYEVKVVDEAGREVGCGTPGQLVVRGTPGRSLMLGYLKNPEATAETLRVGEDGTWLQSGDTVTYDPEGFIHFCDRSKDLIKRSGENISSTEIEGVIALLPQVAEVAVVGVADSVRDEAVAAVVVLKESAALTEGEVRAHCSRFLASFKIPERIRFVEALPRTSVGKIQKQMIRGWFAG
jgi:crotonobetaine/carnitine-CoA ligase